ncbi:LacI family DNA-binding transcriptional regulator [Saccharothrix sp.]|uniref:LacI family DNA-binding transcriptional regulator n=1 Tax=Saccharothrix sp. TaxID=1873460 RepID=UPI002811F0E5|nr:LacI family DNA-binding transcriptional regulator [Saccharothrix sp.]
MATLKDVAALAGVSVKTVSNVVNGYAFVKPDNRRRVEEALVATGYRPNLGARNLRRGRTGSLALVVPELGIPYFAELAGLVLRAARAHDWNVLIQQTLGTREGEREALAALGPHVVDGAVISPEALRGTDFAGVSGPLVLLGEHPLDLPLDHVGIDNVEAARTAVRHLLDLGRRRIAAIGAHPDRATAAQRLRGHREALADAGLTGPVASVEHYHRRDGAAAMAALLDSPEPPDAVFCFNDLLAAGALRAAADRGVRVPGDVAVVGFDDDEAGAYGSPSLTTIAPDKAGIARAAVDLLRERVDGRDLPPRRVRTPFRLRIRESTVG